MTVMGGSYWIGKINRDGKPRIRVWDYDEAMGTRAILDGQWQHLAMSHAADGHAKVWVDGVLEGSGQIPVVTSRSGIHDLGRGWRHNGGDTTWIGDLDDIRAYDQILNEGEIRASMADDRAGPTTAPESDGDFRPEVPEAPTASGSLGDGGGGGGKGCGIGSGSTLLVASLALGLGRRRRVG